MAKLSEGRSPEGAQEPVENQTQPANATPLGRAAIGVVIMLLIGMALIRLSASFASPTSQVAPVTIAAPTPTVVATLTIAPR